VKTQKQRSEEKRQAKLELIRQQIDAGTLVVRQMTGEERARFQRRADAGKKRRPRS
jgi:hypothetical protein